MRRHLSALRMALNPETKPIVNAVHRMSITRKEGPISHAPVVAGLASGPSAKNVYK